MGKICSSLMSMSKLPLMTTEPRFSLCLPRLCLRAEKPPAPCPLISPHPKEGGFSRYLFHPGSYVLPQSQLPALQFSQPQALPNLLVREAELFGPPQGLFWNGFTGMKQTKKNAWSFTAILRRHTSTHVSHTALGGSRYRSMHMKARKGRQPC